MVHHRCVFQGALAEMFTVLMRVLKRFDEGVDVAVVVHHKAAWPHRFRLRANAARDGWNTMQAGFVDDSAPRSRGLAQQQVNVGGREHLLNGLSPSVHGVWVTAQFLDVRPPSDELHLCFRPALSQAWQKGMVGHKTSFRRHADHRDPRPSTIATGLPSRPYALGHVLERTKATAKVDRQRHVGCGAKVEG